jgi:hypothetical protein
MIMYIWLNINLSHFKESKNSKIKLKNKLKGYQDNLIRSRW